MSKIAKRISKTAAQERKEVSRARAMIERVRDYHRLGKSNLSVQELMEQHGLSQSAAFKANQFAERYTANEVRALLKLRRESGRPLHWGHVQYLLIVPSDKKHVREALQKKAAEKDWNPRELLGEIRKQFPKRGSGGRPRRNELVPSLIAQVNDVSARVKQIDENLRSGEQSPTKQLRLQLERLDQAAKLLVANIQRARRAGLAANRT